MAYDARSSPQLPMPLLVKASEQHAPRQNFELRSEAACANRRRSNIMGDHPGEG